MTNPFVFTITRLIHCANVNKIDRQTHVNKLLSNCSDLQSLSKYAKHPKVYIFFDIMCDVRWGLHLTLVN